MLRTVACTPYNAVGTRGSNLIRKYCKGCMLVQYMFNNTRRLLRKLGYLEQISEISTLGLRRSVLHQARTGHPFSPSLSLDSTLQIISSSSQKSFQTLMTGGIHVNDSKHFAIHLDYCGSHRGYGYSGIRLRGNRLG